MQSYQPPQPPDIFYRFLFGYASIQDIEEFVYQSETLATYVGVIWEDELLSFDFHAPGAHERLRILIAKILRDIPPTRDIEALLHQADIIDIIKDIQQHRIAIDTGAQAIWNKAYEFLRHPWDDPDFAVFGRITILLEIWQDVETDFQGLIDDIWRKYTDEIQLACTHMLQRFDPYYKNKNKSLNENGLQRF